MDQQQSQLRPTGGEHKNSRRHRVNTRVTEAETVD